MVTGARAQVVNAETVRPDASPSPLHDPDRPAADVSGTAPDGETRDAARSRLDGRPLALVGLMGVGKTTVGRQIANLLGLPFTDADEEIERVSRMSVADLFAEFGEGEFRSLERRVLERLVGEAGPHVLATGGGAFVQADTRAVLRGGAVTVWLRAPLDVLVERTGKRNHRPLLRTGDPRAILARLIEERHPHYAEAEIVIDSTGERREAVAARVVHALAAVPGGQDA